MSKEYAKTKAAIKQLFNAGLISTKQCIKLNRLSEIPFRICTCCNKVYCTDCGTIWTDGNGQHFDDCRFKNCKPCSACGQAMPKSDS